MKMKNIGLLAGAALIIGSAGWYLDRQATAAPVTGKGGAQPPTVVNVIAPRRQDVPVILQANGSVTPISSVDLHPQTTSTIRKVHIKEGQFVKAGELMFSLDDRGSRANVDKAQAQVARDLATLADVERQYRRSQELFAQKFIAQSAVDTLHSQREAARAAVQAGQAALQAERVNAGYSAIRAPMAGRVGAINVYPGTLVQLATSLTTITQLDPINVAFSLPEAALGELLAAHKKGALAVRAQAIGAPGATGTLSFIDNTVDPLAGSIKVKARFDNRTTALWPGQYVNVRVTLQTLKDALVIPQAAIITNTRGTFVYVVDPDHSARQVPVTRVHGFGLDAAVTGLAGGEQVITEGKQNLRPGAKVRLAEAAGAGKRDGAARGPKKAAP